MNYHNFDSLQEMHVEITNRCNAACPMCSRNEFGGKDKPGMDLDEWTTEDARKVFSPKFLNLRNILFCGTHGDPAVAKETLPIVEVVKQQANATIEFYSNGSIRSKEWWSDLGKLFKTKIEDEHYRRTDIGIFSIDGLEDTNHLYRRRTRFEKVIENAEAFIKAGGRARWDFIVFKHNEHQVEEAEKLAKKIGFKQFRIRKTSRFAYSPDGADKFPVRKNDGSFDYYLEPTTIEDYTNAEKKKFNEIVAKLEKGDKATLQKRIKCLNKSQFQRIYISAHMKVFPCCFISSDHYPGSGRVHRDSREKVAGTYGEIFNSLRNESWENILNHSFFAKDLVSSWDMPDKKLVRCQRTCSESCNPITSQSQDRKINGQQKEGGLRA